MHPRLAPADAARNHADPRGVIGLSSVPAWGKSGPRVRRSRFLPLERRPIAPRSGKQTSSQASPMPSSSESQWTREPPRILPIAASPARRARPHPACDAGLRRPRRGHAAVDRAMGAGRARRAGAAGSTARWPRPCVARRRTSARTSDPAPAADAVATIGALPRPRVDRQLPQRRRRCATGSLGPASATSGSTTSPAQGSATSRGGRATDDRAGQLVRRRLLILALLPAPASTPLPTGLRSHFPGIAEE